MEDILLSFTKVRAWGYEDAVRNRQVNKPVSIVIRQKNDFFL